MLKKQIIIGVLVLGAVMLMLPSEDASGEGLTWVTSYEQALKKAGDDNKVIIANFTGSDWCPWCFRIRDEIFNTDTFRKWSSENAVLLELDFPKKKEQAADLKAQNQRLAKKYQIQGFPTILFLDSNGEVLGRTGYMKGGPEPWIKNAESVIKESKTTLAASLSDAVTQAKESGRPVLVLAVEKAKPENEALYKKIVESTAVNALSKTALVAVRVDLPAAQDAESELIAKLKLPSEGIHAVLFDPVKETVLVSEKITSSLESAVAALRAKLPAPEYTGGWTDNYAKARYAAAVTGKPLFLDFTGSDWCGWCKKLENEIFSKDEFKKYAQENLILVKLDFPKKKELPEKLVAQNRSLAMKFGIQGFPTLIILDPSGKKIGQAGYMKGGPVPFIDNLKTIIK